MEILSTRPGTDRRKVGVIGVGHLGQYHVEKYSHIPEASLIGIYDVDTQRSLEIASRFKTRAFTKLSELLEETEAVSVVVPTALHHEIAARALEAGCDVLLEKPITDCSGSAKELIRISEREGHLLQVGHVERFNPAFQRASTLLTSPRLIETFRWAPWPKRSLDVDVLLDVMVHDVDLVLSLFSSHKVEDIHAVGQRTAGEKLDSATAILRFEGNRWASLSVSRIAHRAERLLRIHQGGEVLHVDLLSRQVIRSTPENPAVEISPQRSDQDALHEELRSFVLSSLSRSAPLVSASDGVRAIELIEKIRETIK